MTEKELHKLHRPGLFQLLFTQAKEVEDLQKQLTEFSASLKEKKNTVERLKARLDEKDILIERLESRLDERDVTINRQKEEIEAYRADGKKMLKFVEEASLRLNGVFGEAQRAADAYLYSLRQMGEEYVMTEKAENMPLQEETTPPQEEAIPPQEEATLLQEEEPSEECFYG